MLKKLPNHNLSLGQKGESLAEEWLKSQKKWRILERNWRSGSFAELDIVALDSSGRLPVLVAVEVKTRASRQFGRGIEAITPFKLHALKRSFLFYKRAHPELPDLLRIDVVDILLENPQAPDIKYYRDVSS